MLEIQVSMLYYCWICLCRDNVPELCPVCKVLIGNLKKLKGKDQMVKKYAVRKYIFVPKMSMSICSALPCYRH